MFGLAAGAVAGCASGNVPADVRVPPELLRGSPYTAGGEPARTRYVIRMTDGQRDWEIQLPEIATAYEVKVPLTGRADVAAGGGHGHDDVGRPRDPGAERSLAARARRRRRQERRQRRRQEASAATRTGDKKGDKKSAGKPRAGQTPPAARPSYLLTLERVKELYRTRHYELGLVELVELEKQYPEDEHVLSMKGSLYERLGNKALARDAWQQVLRINPYNLAVLEALQRLGK